MLSRLNHLKPLYACIICLLATTGVSAREIGIAFINDGLGEPTPPLSEVIVQELAPLLSREDTVKPMVLNSGGSVEEFNASLAQANADSAIDYIVVTGFIGSQRLYQQPKFDKPSYLLKVLDPSLTGEAVRDTVHNLQSYSSENGVLDSFIRIASLFKAKRVGIVLPPSGPDPRKTISRAVDAAGKATLMQARFVALDFSKEIDTQLDGLDAVILPPVTMDASQQQTLLDALIRKKIPSLALGDAWVRNGALISDTLDEDSRVLARRVALDLQLAINGESKTMGMSMLQPKKHTTINIDTVRAIGLDISLDELLTARVVQSSNGTELGFLPALAMAQVRNVDLKGQSLQRQIDEESLEQALAQRRPQLAARIGHTQRGEQLPQHDTSVAFSVNQVIYSPSVNTAIDLAKLGLEASEQSLAQKKLDTIQSASTAYFQVLQAQAQFDIYLRDLTLSRENLELAEQRKNTGSGTGADIYRWQAIIAASESATLRAYTANISAQSQLAQILDMRTRLPFAVEEVDLDLPPFDLLHAGIEPYLNTTGQTDALKKVSSELAIQQSPQLEAVTASVGANDLQVKALKRAYYTPEVSLTAQYAGFLDGSKNAQGVDVGGEGDWSVTVSGDLPLWLGGTRRSLMRQYNAQSALAETQLQSSQQALWVASTNAVNSLAANYRTIGLSEKAEAAALKSQQITQGAYRLGAASVTELRDTQNAYREAQSNTSIARYQYLNALVDFQALLGEMPMLMSGAEQTQWLQEFKQNMLEGAQQ